MVPGSHTAVGYTGERGSLFGLALKTGLLTVLTLGIYRFWAKTRIRRYLWSSVSVDGDRLEYSGTGLEKLLGFLAAVVILAVYLGIVQLLLFYFGLHFVVEPESGEEALMQLAVIYISLLAVLPLMLFASYRARRYLMARTRLRGIRFGMDAAAWGYVWRALLHYLMTLLTLGILLPRQTFWLEKYKADRTHYGDARFVQGGRWVALYPAMIHLGIAAAILAASVVLLALTEDPTRAVPLGVLGYGWGFFGWAFYAVRSRRYLDSHKMLGGSVGFVAEPRVGRVIAIYALGFLAVGLAGGAIFAVASALTAVAVGSLTGAEGTGAAGIVIVALLYLATFAVFGALTLAYITQPLIAHFCETLTVLNLEALQSVRQRPHDRGADAEGFADALDIGAAI
ncbi:YjgN family protein [Defluviimonas sp. WL0002]|uniref:YjgN family protein n=1 Tax=Albidovulum marisflavi TaxID=2984159 RepID=A0ABT2ZHL0_9RHOB|nr:YjgN family protein [Defluviimonas sp. WL0002]MCV2870596.1 YjgN family protein [Defluviimonas sp. WL0002]